MKRGRSRVNRKIARFVGLILKEECGGRLGVCTYCRAFGVGNASGSFGLGLGPALLSRVPLAHHFHLPKNYEEHSTSKSLSEELLVPGSSLHSTSQESFNLPETGQL